MTFETRQKPKMVKPAIAIILVVLALGIGLVYALISQQVPSVTIPANGPSTTSNCSAVMNETNPTPLTGAILFGCGSPPGTPAFTVNYPSQNVPTFALSHSATSTAFLHFVTATSQCTVTVNVDNMTSGQANTFNGSGSFYYCETYYGFPAVGGTQGSFTVTWSP